MDEFQRLERFKKYHSRSVGAVFFGFGFVSAARLQAAAGMLLRQSLAKTQKILAPNGHTIF